MSKPTAQTGPSGLVRPETPNPEVLATVRRGLTRATEFEAALAQLREFATDQPALPRHVRQDLEFAKRTADEAPDLFDMGAGTKGRFTVIATVLGDVLTALDKQTQR